jgi:hypothetical protein
MRTIKTYCKGAPFYNAFLRTWLNYRNHNAWMSRLSVSIAPASEDEFEHYLFGRRRKNPRKAK